MFRGNLGFSPALVAGCLVLCILGAGSQALAQNGFVLGPGDVLSVSVWKDEALSGEALVRPDGRISFPLIGDVPASGRTVDELRADIQDKISAFVPDAPVTVVLAELQSTAVFVVGKVARPGRYVMTGPARVLQAIAMAGGLTTFADSDSILILRDAGGVQKSFAFDYDALASGRDLTANITLTPGDTIVVP